MTVFQMLFWGLYMRVGGDQMEKQMHFPSVYVSICVSSAELYVYFYMNVIHRAAKSVSIKII